MRMKKTLLLVLLACTLQGQAQSNNVTREGNTFRATTTATTAKADTKTKYTWQNAKGEDYPIYLSKNGHAYVIRTSKKTGKTYRQYIGEDISRTICKEVGVKYIVTNNKK